jgi:hypothetical protein
MADILVLGSTDPVPTNTPPGTVILRQSSAPPLNLNTGYETNVSNWTASGGTLARDTTVFKSGVASAKLTSAGGNATISFLSDKFPVTAANLYRFSAWLRCSISTTVSLTVNWYNASNTLLSSTTVSISVPANTWISLASMGQAPTGATQAAIAPTLGGTPAAGVTFNADDVIFGL